MGCYHNMKRTLARNLLKCCKQTKKKMVSKQTEKLRTLIITMLFTLILKFAEFPLRSLLLLQCLFAPK